MILQQLSIAQVAAWIKDDWKKVSPYAEPYLAAMRTLDTLDDHYGLDDGRSIVAYFLANASGWKGPVAREIKAELNRRLK